MVVFVVCGGTHHGRVHSDDDVDDLAEMGRRAYACAGNECILETTVCTHSISCSLRVPSHLSLCGAVQIILRLLEFANANVQERSPRIETTRPPYVDTEGNRVEIKFSYELVVARALQYPMALGVTRCISGRVLRT